MTMNKPGGITPARPLRLWPGLALAALVLTLRYGVLMVAEGATAGYIGMFGGLLCALAIFVWWAFFSRARWTERVGAVALVVLGFVLTPALLHPSIAGGMMGFMFYLYALPVVGLAFVAWAVATRRLRDGVRRATMVAVILLAFGVWTLLRTEGITGEGDAQFAWRWSLTPEERLLAAAQEGIAALPRDEPPAAAEATPTPLEEAPTGQVSGADAGSDAGAETAIEAEAPSAAGTATEAPAADASAPTPPSAPAVMRAAWPGFRGPARDSVIRGVAIATNWAESPPREIWRRPIGPGWSSFAVASGFLYTQEQRGDEEIVACYRADTGEPVWAHRDEARFWESNGGPGPRATPTLHGGRVYTFGATGILNALDARSGAVVWSRNAASDTSTEVPIWGFSSSPIVVDDVVIVAVEGKLAAFDRQTGAPRWVGPDGGGSYSSPQLVTIDGIPQVVLLTAIGATSVSPSDGTLLWKHEWPSDSRIVQPALVADGELLLGSGFQTGLGMRRIAVAHGEAGWTTEERWTSMGLKPYYNDFVVHEGHAYGFDGSILACIDIADGTRKWKGGRYGHGQLVLLADQDLLLVVAEEGDLALVRAAPDRYAEVARVPAIEGKTWNHPVLVGDLLVVRNGEEMAAFRLSRKEMGE